MTARADCRVLAAPVHRLARAKFVFLAGVAETSTCREVMYSDVTVIIVFFASDEISEQYEYILVKQSL